MSTIMPIGANRTSSRRAEEKKEDSKFMETVKRVVEYVKNTEATGASKWKGGGGGR